MIRTPELGVGMFTLICEGITGVWANTLLTPKAKREKVIFFGVPYVKAWGISEKQYANGINSYLRFIKKYFGGKYDLEYRPHPREIFGKVKLNIKGFKFVVLQKLWLGERVASHDLKVLDTM